MIGIALAAPIVLYQVWAFVAPGLTPHERRLARPWVPLALLFLVLGVGVAYVDPALRDGVPDQLPDTRARSSRWLTAEAYFGFVTTLFLVFGLVMQFPHRAGAALEDRHDHRRAAEAQPSLRGRGDRHICGCRDARRRPGQPNDDGAGDVPVVRAVDLSHRPVRATDHPAQLMADDVREDLTDDDDESSPTPRPCSRVRTGGPRTSRSSPACPARARRRSASCSRTSATASSTTCRSSSSGGLAQLVAHDSGRFERLALVLDARTGNAPLAFAAAVGALEGRGIKPQVFFLEASDEVLIRRFSETRHRHPLDNDGRRGRLDRARARAAGRRAQPGGRDHRHHRAVDAPAARARLFGARAAAATDGDIAVNLISFGYKHGIPLEADLVFDVRFMENPFYNDELRPLSGLDRGGPPLRPGQAADAAVPRVPARLPRLRAARLPGRGQSAPDHRHRLHRRLPSVDRHRRGAGAQTCAHRATRRSASGIASSIDE